MTNDPVDDDFYEDDEPIEKIQETRRRPPDFVTGEPPAANCPRCHGGDDDCPICELLRHAARNGGQVIGFGVTIGPVRRPRRPNILVPVFAGIGAGAVAVQFAAVWGANPLIQLGVGVVALFTGMMLAALDIDHHVIGRRRRRPLWPKRIPEPREQPNRESM